MTRSVAYIRVSTDKQDNSADAQERRIRNWVALKEWDLIDVVIDIDEFSGNLDRPGAQKVIGMVRNKEVDAVIIVKLDRMTRSTKDALELIELFNRKDVAFVSIEETIDTKSPMGEFFLTVMAALAQLERKMIGSRTKAGLQNLKAQGFPAGKAPYGFTSQSRTAEERQLKIRKKLLVNEDEQDVIRKIMDMRSGGMSHEKVANELNSLGIKTRSGAPWVKQYVAGILKSAA